MKDGILLIGVGNEFRGDDGLGPAVARELRGAHHAGLTVREQSGEGAALLEAWKGWRTVLLVDAVRSGAEPGTLHRIDCVAQPLPRGMRTSSSHAFGVAEAIETARNLGTLPGVLLLYGIEGERFGMGEWLGEAVGRSVPALVARIEADILHLQATSSGKDPT